MAGDVLLGYLQARGYATQLQLIHPLSPSFLMAWSKADFTILFHKGVNV